MQHGEQPGRTSCADELNEAGGVLIEGGTHHEDFQSEASIVQHRNVSRTELIRIAGRDMKYYVGDRLGFGQLCRLVQRSPQINGASCRKIDEIANRCFSASECRPRSRRVVIGALSRGRRAGRRQVNEGSTPPGSTSIPLASITRAPAPAVKLRPISAITPF